MNTTELAYMIYEWRQDNGIWGNPDRDYSCARYLIDLGHTKHTKLEWETLFKYHYV